MSIDATIHSAASYMPLLYTLSRGVARLPMMGFINLELTGGKKSQVQEQNCRLP